MPSIGRREALLFGGSALLCAATPFAAQAAAGSRALTLYRDGSEIGSKTVSVRREGDTVAVETSIDIRVAILGITAYRYKLRADETWRGGELMRLRAETNDNGEAHFARADREGGALRIEGSVFSGVAGGSPATTSYWSPEFLNRPVWISTQDGRLLNVTATRLGATQFETGAGPVEATRWRIGGDLTDLYLYYDAAGEWLGTEFPARGEMARFVATARNPALTPLWVNA
jgi:hypothetical protein